ncbi:MAG: HPF/RaiA family ribosome-associated protein [bacterium]|jgi:ribosome-associated translation inhibitor RaiA|nr:HPF/RaiA family ribosome-associated protein [Planctomycetota bacterium]HIL52381.1 HPF/RaiA family ribosome-associated protein [Planctomycetota bacterium]
MLIQVHFDEVQKTDALDQFINDQVQHHLAHVASRITRIEVHVHDENSPSKAAANDKRCTMEARPAGRQPLAVEHRGDNVQKVISETAGKLERALKRMFDKAR